MKKDLIKMRVQCWFDCEPAFGVITYEDDVPDESHAWKGTRRHNDESVVGIGETWTQVSGPREESGPMWSAYVILDGASGKAQCRKWIGELFSTVERLMRPEAEQFQMRLSQMSLDMGAFEKALAEYGVDGE